MIHPDLLYMANVRDRGDGVPGSLVGRVAPVGAALVPIRGRSPCTPYDATMHAEQMAEDYPAVVPLDAAAIDAAQLLAEHRLPGLVVTDSDEPRAVLPASQVVRFLVPTYVQDDPSLARVLGENMADYAADAL